MRSLQEKIAFVLVTTITNLAYIPVIVLFYYQAREFEMFLAYFTMITSFMYHLCDSIQQRVIMSAGMWHRLDNIGSILAFCCWFIHLAGFQTQRIEDRIKYFFAAVVLFCQEYAPWDIRFTVGPILMAFSCFFIRLVFFRHLMAPTILIKRKLTTGSILLVLAILCFIRGLNEVTDPYRIFHGGWHFFGGAASFYLWQFRVSGHKKPLKPESIA